MSNGIPQKIPGYQTPRPTTLGRPNSPSATPMAPGHAPLPTTQEIRSSVEAFRLTQRAILAEIHKTPPKSSERPAAGTPTKRDGNVADVLGGGSGLLTPSKETPIVPPDRPPAGTPTKKDGNVAEIFQSNSDPKQPVEKQPKVDLNRPAAGSPTKRTGSVAESIKHDSKPKKLPIALVRAWKEKIHKQLLGKLGKDGEKLIGKKSHNPIFQKAISEIKPGSDLNLDNLIVKVKTAKLELELEKAEPNVHKIDLMVEGTPSEHNQIRFEIPGHGKGVFSHYKSAGPTKHPNIIAIASHGFTRSEEGELLPFTPGSNTPKTYGFMVKDKITLVRVMSGDGNIYRRLTDILSKQVGKAPFAIDEGVPNLMLRPQGPELNTISDRNSLGMLLTHCDLMIFDDYRADRDPHPSQSDMTLKDVIEHTSDELKKFQEYDAILMLTCRTPWAGGEGARVDTSEPNLQSPLYAYNDQLVNGV